MPKNRSNYRPGIYLELSLLESPAFLSLKAPAIKILFRFLAKRVLKRVGTGKREAKIFANNGEITLTYAEAGFNPHTVSTALKSLMARGFISLASPGGFENGHNTPARYTVHVGFDGQDRDASWRTWQPVELASSPGIAKRTLNLSQFRARQEKKPTVLDRSRSAVQNRSGS